MLLISMILMAMINDENVIIDGWIPVTGQGYLCVDVHEEAILGVLMMDNYDLTISSNHKKMDAAARVWP